MPGGPLGFRRLIRVGILHQVEKRHYLDERGMQDNVQAQHLVVRNKGKKPIVLDDVDIQIDDELSSDSSPDPSSIKSSKDRSRQRHSHHSAFSNSNNGTFRRAMGRGQNQSKEAPGNVFTLPTGAIPPIQPVYLAFRTRPALYIQPTTAI